MWAHPNEFRDLLSFKTSCPHSWVRLDKLFITDQISLSPALSVNIWTSSSSLNFRYCWDTISEDDMWHVSQLHLWDQADVSGKIIHTHTRTHMHICTHMSLCESFWMVYINMEITEFARNLLVSTRYWITFLQIFASGYYLYLIKTRDEFICLWGKCRNFKAL